MQRLQKWLDDGHLHVRFNLVALVVLLCMFPPTMTIWKDAIWLLQAYSWYALFSQHLTGLVAAKAEVKAGER